jgi:hypothetical protein
MVAMNAVMMSHYTERDELVKCIELLKAEAEALLKLHFFAASWQIIV